MAGNGKKTWTTEAIRQKLATKHFGRDSAIIFEVPNGTGMARDRSADAIAMNLWPSKGLHLHGYEIKVSRSDWQKEMQDVAKAEAFARYCHYWWLVAPPDVAKLEEIPSSWGWMVPTAGGLRVRKPADIRQPQPPDVTFLAGLFRALSDAHAATPYAAEIEAAERTGYERGKADASEARDWRMKHVVEQQAADAKIIADFEAVSGINLRSWDFRNNVGRCGAAVKMLLSDPASMRRKFERHVEATEEIVGQLRAAVAELGELPTVQITGSSQTGRNHA